MKLRLVSLLLVLAMIALSGCTQNEWCGDGVCSEEKGESFQSCPVDCKEEPAKTALDGILEIKVQPAQASAIVGEDLSFEVVVSGAKELSGFQFNLEYDPEALEFQEAIDGGFFSNDFQEELFCVEQKQERGLVRNIACAKMGGGGVSGSGVVEKISFKALKPASSQVTLSNVKLVDSKAEAVEVTVANAMVIVQE